MRSVLSQELVLKTNGRILHAILFGTSTTLESHAKAIATINPKNVAGTDVRVPKSEAHRFLIPISEESARFSQTSYGARTEGELLRAILGNHIDVKIVKTVVTIEPGPHKAHIGAGVTNLDSGTIPHGRTSICRGHFVSWR